MARARRVTEGTPFIIAMNTGTIAASSIPRYYSYAAKSVFALGAEGFTVPVNTETGRAASSKSEHSVESMLGFTSPSGVLKPADWFNSQKCPEVSAIIWSKEHIANAFLMNGRDCELILNLNASNPLPQALLRFGTVTWAVKTGADYEIYHRERSELNAIDS